MKPRGLPAQKALKPRRELVSLAIEEAALRLFLERDPDLVTADDIAAAAGVSRRTFFRYFASREDVLTATPARSLLQSIRAIQERPASESIVEALLATAGSRTGQEEDALTGLSAQVMARFPQAWSRALGRLRKQTDAAFSEVVAERLRKGGRSEVGAEVIGTTLAAVVVQVHRSWVNDGCAGTFAERLEEGLQQISQILGDWQPR